MTNMVLMYRQLTGRDYQFTKEGKGSNLFSLISNPRENKFTIKSAIRVESSQKANILNPSQIINLSLPNDMYRKELQIRGNIALNTLNKYLGNTEKKTPGLLQNAIAEVSNFVNADREADAIKLIQETIEQYGKDLDAANKIYESNFESRSRDIILEMKRKNLLNPESIEKLEKLGYANPQGRIVK